MQPRQHKADQCDVFRITETYLGDQPQPTDRRLAWLTRLSSLPFEILALSASRASTYFQVIQSNNTHNITTIALGTYYTAWEAG